MIENLADDLEVVCSDDGGFADSMRRIEQLVDEVDALEDSQLRAKATELIELLLDVHRSGFGRVISLVAQAGVTGPELLSKFAADPVVSSFLLLYDLHPADFETRLQQALNKVRPLMQSHGGNVELLSSDHGEVRLRLLGSCHGCPSSTLTLQNAVEAAIYEFAPDTTRLEVEGVVGEPFPAELISLSLATADA